ncbi:MAG: alpha-glucan family phosphorylase [Actinomycetota bacterium]
MTSKPLHSFTVRVQLPEVLAPLREMAMNLRWIWDTRTQDLFRWVEPELWEATAHDPIKLLSLAPRERLEALAKNRSFRSFLNETYEDLKHYLERPRWFNERPESSLRSVAYFSPEFGIHHTLPQYSGGLGVLAGDHLKSAGALGVPVVGVGLLYRQGYFRQELDADGWQRERYITLNPAEMALVSVGRITVELADAPVIAEIWKVLLGRVPLYLLDTNLEGNDEEGRLVTDRLYGGPEEHRIRQEILLGMGGVQALAALREAPQIFHINEGHAGFSGLERIRRLMAEEKLGFGEAVEAVRAGAVFTTHTPVAAGIDRFPRWLMEKYFKGWSQSADIDFEELMALGHGPGDSPEAPFNMAVLCLRLSGQANGVSRLHGKVSRNLFGNLWPDVPEEEIPISAITNGVHAYTWVSEEMASLFRHHVLPEWYDVEPERWEGILEASDEDIWRAREQGRERLVAFVRRRLKEAGRARGMSEGDLTWCDEVLDPGVLTIGFARRFASYKRPTLLLTEPERLKALICARDRPVQLVLAGKAHPADDEGKQMIRHILQFAQDPDVRRRMAFIEDYDMEVGRMLCQGCDLWLNNPRRPLEASGTSGQKAALNGGLNCSILDGWWDEMYDGRNGWAIPAAGLFQESHRRDQSEANHLYELLERRIIPLFYERVNGSVPHGWVGRIKASLRSLSPAVNATRMMREYVELAYDPAASRTENLAVNGYAGARALAAWKQHIRSHWSEVVIEAIGPDLAVADLESRHLVGARVWLGSLTPQDLAVELLHGSLGIDEHLHSPTIESMTLTRMESDPRSCIYEGAFSCPRPGRYGFAVRVVPYHPAIATYAEVGCLTWASPSRTERGLIPG